MPLVAKSTNLAGKASIIGGGLTRVAGWIVLAGGTAFGLAMLGILQALFPAGFAGWAVGGPIIAIAVTVGALLLRGGKSLESSGAAEQRDTHTSAIFQLAEHNQNTVTAEQVAAAIGISTASADELLTSLAKTQPEYVVLEVGEQGNVFYRVSARGLSRVASFDEKLRVAQEAAVMGDEESRVESGSHLGALRRRT
jgi:parvulin-like peptidyl-prolyl isomerase